MNPNPKDGEEAALSKAGPELYDKIFKHYTFKQWAKYPAQLDASVLLRIPVRTNRDDRYFTDKRQAIPSHGYTRIFENMLLKNPLITIRTGVDYFACKDKLPKRSLLIFTGPIDAYYSSLGMPKARCADADAEACLVSGLLCGCARKTSGADVCLLLLKTRSWSTARCASRRSTTSRRAATTRRRCRRAPPTPAVAVLRWRRADTPCAPPAKH